MTAMVPEEPRNGQYLPTYTYVDTEGGGDLHVNAVMCRECFALIDEPNLDSHMGKVHESGEGSQPKKM